MTPTSEAASGPPFEEEFFVGYLAAPAGVARFVRGAAGLLLVAAAILPLPLVLGQRPFDPSSFEFGVARAYEGDLRVRPFPILVADGSGPWLLVGEGKFSADLAALHGRRVRLEGTKISRPEGRALEVVAGSVRPGGAARPIEAPSPLGEGTLRGEIVDPKCWLGVMNPGREKPHRACAIRCLSGGIPPVLVARENGGPASVWILLGRDGNPLPRTFLRWVGRPVEISGASEMRDGYWFLLTDPATWREVR